MTQDQEFDRHWEYDDELEAFLRGITVREAHTKNARRGTKEEHQRGLTRMQMDQAGEKKDKPRRAGGRETVRKTRRRSGLLIRTLARKGNQTVLQLLDGQAVEITYDFSDDRIEYFIEGIKRSHLIWQSMPPKLPIGTEVAWIDFSKRKYCWLEITS